MALTLIAFLPAAAGAASEGLVSEYTSLQDCETLQRVRLPGRTIEAGAGNGVFRCKGAGGFSVYVVDEDPRSFLALERDGKLTSLEQPMVGQFTLGDFPNVSGAKKAEWRLDPRGKPVGLIVRVSYMRRDAAGGAASAL